MNSMLLIDMKYFSSLSNFILKVNPSSSLFPALTRCFKHGLRVRFFILDLVLCGELSFFITCYGPIFATPSHVGAAPPGFFVLFPARTVIIPAGSMRIYNSSSFLFPGLLYPPGAPPCSFYQCSNALPWSWPCRLLRGGSTGTTPGLGASSL